MPYVQDDSTHEYYNVRIQNGNSDGQPTVCAFREQRTVPIIENPSEYYFSCIRFNVPTSTIPLLIIPVQPYPNTDTSKTIYSISLSFNGYTSRQYLIWSPNEAFSSDASPVTPKYGLNNVMKGSDASDSFYYCRSYNQFLIMVNNAFAAATADLIANATLPDDATAPYVLYDSNSKLFTIKAMAKYFASGSEMQVNIYFNNDLFSLLGAFNHILARRSPDGKERQILMNKLPDNSNVDGSGIISIVQEYSTLVNWMGFRSIIITTGSIPIESEGIPLALPYYGASSVATGEPIFLNIISDYDALLDAGGAQDFQSSFQYAYSGEYRLIDLKGTQALTSFDIQVYWSDVFGGLHELMINPNESASFKFLFRKKSFNHSI